MRRASRLAGISTIIARRSFVCVLHMKKCAHMHTQISIGVCNSSMNSNNNCCQTNATRVVATCKSSATVDSVYRISHKYCKLGIETPYNFYSLDCLALFFHFLKNAMFVASGFRGVLLRGLMFLFVPLVARVRYCAVQSVRYAADVRRITRVASGATDTQTIIK